MKIKYVDLGLSSGTLWADRNVGAEKPSDYGKYCTFKTTQPYGIIPTYEQIKELVDFTNYSIYIQNGIKGIKFTGQNNNSIFIPFAGFFNYNDSSFHTVNCVGRVLSCTFNDSCPYYLYFDNSGIIFLQYLPNNNDMYGFSVRLIKNILWK